MQANSMDFNRIGGKIKATLVGLSGIEQLLLALIFIRAGVIIALTFSRGNMSDGLYIAILAAELFTMFIMLIDGGYHRIDRFLLRLAVICVAAVCLCFTAYVNAVITDYLNNVQFRITVLILQCALMLCMLVYCVISSIIYINELFALREIKTVMLSRKSLTSFALTVLVLAASVTSYFLIKSLDTIETDEDCYQAVKGEFINYSGDSSIVKAGNMCTIKNNNQVTELNSLPLYFPDEDKIILPDLYCLIRPTLSLNNKVLNLSEIHKEDEVYYVYREGNDIPVWDFFLFDGKNTYVFFENSMISVGGRTIPITPFSYVTAVYNKSVSVFNPETMEYTTVPIGKEAVNVMMSDGTIVNVSMDLINRTDGQEQMLFIQPNLLEEISE